MALIKRIIKLNHVEALVKIVKTIPNTSETVTISLATDLLRSNEELSGEPVTVAISSIETSLANSGQTDIVRNGEVIVNLFENTTGVEFAYGADTTNSTSDIVVNMNQPGTVYMRLLKHHGYRPLFRPEQGVN